MSARGWSVVGVLTAAYFAAAAVVVVGALIGGWSR